jgi:hypothetical protein
MGFLMNVYPTAVDAFMLGSFSMTAATIKAQLVTGAYGYSSVHQFFSSVGGRVGSPVALTGRAVGNEYFSSGPLVFPAVTTGSTIAAVVIYRDSGSEASSQLIAHLNRRADTTPLAIITDGGDITLTWPVGGRVFKL